MTAPFMAATPLSTAPFLTIEKKTDALSPGTPVPFRPALAGAPKKIRFNQDLNMMAMASEFRRADIGGLGNPAYLFRGKLSFAPDDDYIIANGGGGELAKLVRRQGPYYLPQAGLPLPTAAGSLLAASGMSKNANYIALVRSDSLSTLRIFTKATDAAGADTWTEVQQIALANGVTAFSTIKVSDNGRYVWVKRFQTLSSGSMGSLFYRASTTFAAVTFTGIPTDCTFIGALNAYVVGVTSAMMGGMASADVASGVVTARTTFANPGLTNPTFATVSPNGENVAFQGQAFFRLIHWTGSAWVTLASTNPANNTFNSDPEPTWSPTGLFCVWGRADNTQANRLFQVYKLNAVAGAASAALYWTLTNIANNPSRFIWSTDEVALSVYTISGPLSSAIMTGAAPVTSTTLPFFGTTLFSTMFDLVYGRTTRLGAYATDNVNAPTWVNFSVRDGAGDYFSMATLEGTFVSVYDIASDGTGAFVERDFYQHIAGSVVSDIVISLNNKCVVYDIRRTDSGATGLGRYVMDLTDATKIQYRGVIQLANDISTLAAFSVDSAYMALSVRNSGGNNLKLYKFNADYSFVLKDTDLEDYGPPAWSQCDTVIVAHGGVQPYSLYNHVLSPDTLVEQPINIPNWNNQSQIIFVAVTPDCKGIIVVDDHDNVTTISDGSVVATEPGGLGGSGGSGGGGGPTAGAGGGGGGSTDINWPGGSVSVDNTTKTITNLIYIDYTATSVTPRTWL